MQSQPLHSTTPDQQEIRLRETRLERESETHKLEKLRAKLRILLKTAESRTVDAFS